MANSATQARRPKLMKIGHFLPLNKLNGLERPKVMTESESNPRRLGYARVSTCGQTLDAQLEHLRKAGCVKIFREKASGARAERRELLLLLKRLAPGDEVTVTRIDRLARSTFDLFAIVKRIVDTGAHFRSLAEPWADTSTSTGRLMIAVLGGLADVERDLIRTRTAEGRARARARGQRMGRPRKLTARQQRDALEMRAAGATLDEVAKQFNVARATISRLRVQSV
jgi:DNA invertase Pin-like site-specific DNA recombinase